MRSVVPEAKKHFSMLRTFALADLFTFGNVICGMGAIFACMHQLATGDLQPLKHAFWLLPLALFMDGLDGRVARWRQKNSILGADLDSRFNVTASALADETGKVKYFEGTPIPTSLLIVLLLWIQHRSGLSGDALWGGVLHIGPFDWHAFNAAYLILGSTMISATLRIPKI